MSLRTGSRFFCNNCAYDCETEADILAHFKKSEHTFFVDMDRGNFDKDNMIIQLTVPHFADKSRHHHSKWVCFDLFNWACHSIVK